MKNVRGRRREAARIKRIEPRGMAACEPALGAHVGGMKFMIYQTVFGRSGLRGRHARMTGLALVLGFFLTGCVSPDTRIKRNQAVFDQLAPTEQALIREGKVAIGFTPDMVRLAVGDPDQRWARTDASGTSEVWTYATYESNLGVTLYRGYYHRFHGGYPFYYDTFYRSAARPREYFRVTFVEGAVSEIQEDIR